MKKSLTNRSGQGLVEYILIVALIAVVAIVAVKLLGSKVKTGFNDSANKISTEVNAANSSN